MRLITTRHELVLVYLFAYKYFNFIWGNLITQFSYILIG